MATEIQGLPEAHRETKDGAGMGLAGYSGLGSQDWSARRVTLMSVSIADGFRLLMLRHLAGISSFAASWRHWSPPISAALGSRPSGSSVFALGDQLSSIFRTNSVGARSNAAVSQGGTAWEGLICWYLNLIFWGSDTVVIRPHSKFLPSVIKDALSVSIQNVSTNTESDLVAVSIPNGLMPGNANVSVIDQILRSNVRLASVCVIQCKTNWNDNSQIPMLWDLIYNSTNFRVPGVSVGRNGMSPASFKRFAYAFVTVPTSRGSFSPSSLPVLRVRGLTGGNYWGHGTRVGVAKSINEFFTTNFPTTFGGSIQTHIQNSIISSPVILNKFLTLSF